MNKVEQQGKRFQEVLLSKYDFSYLPKFESFMNVLPPQQQSFFTYYNPKNRAFAYQGTFKKLHLHHSLQHTIFYKKIQNQNWLLQKNNS